MLDAQPAAGYPASPDDPSRKVLTKKSVLNDSTNTRYKTLHYTEIYDIFICTALLWQKEASDIPSKFELLMFS